MASSIRKSFTYLAPINWYPGHMATASRNIADRLRGVDVIIDVRDARIPFSSANPTLASMFHNKPRVVVLNKADRCNRRSQDEIVEYYRQQGTPAVCTVAHKGQGIKQLLRTVVDHAQSNGQFKVVGTIAMVTGIPNVGKSTLINAVRQQHRDGIPAGMKSKKSRVARMGAKPGVTRHISNIQVSYDPATFLVDTPGIMVPKVETPDMGLKLALCSCVKDTVVPLDILADFLLFQLNRLGNSRYVDVFGLEGPSDDIFDVLPQVAENLAAKQSKSLGELDTEAAARFMLKCFRSGKLGKLVLDDFPEGWTAPTHLVSARKKQAQARARHRGRDRGRKGGRGGRSQRRG